MEAATSAKRVTIWKVFIVTSIVVFGNTSLLFYLLSTDVRQKPPRWPDLPEPPFNLGRQTGGDAGGNFRVLRKNFLDWATRCPSWFP